MNIKGMREIEQNTIAAVRVKDPSRVEHSAIPDPDLIMGRIGVTHLSKDRANGYIRLYPQDFLVEEITDKGELVRLTDEPRFIDSEDRRTLWADLIKIQYSGPQAIDELKNLLSLDDNQLMVAGMKDSYAITSQRVSLRNVTREAAEAIDHPNLFLRPVSYGNGALVPGALKGNSFTIVIRSEVEKSRGQFERALGYIKQNGFLNFFGPQRFGSRLNIHQLGKKLAQGDVTGALQNYLGEPGPFDVPLFRDMRQALASSWGNWDQMLKYTEHFPFTLMNEAKVIESLKQDERKTRFALLQIKDQVRIWVYAYGSWLVNRVISRAVDRGETLPAELPMPFSPSGPLPLYRDLMEADGTLDFVKNLSYYNYINLADRNIPVVMHPGSLETEDIPQGWVVRFALDKGGYYSSLLSHLVKLYDGPVVPEWANSDEVDSLKVLGQNSIETLRQKFSPFMKRRGMVEAGEEE